MLTFVEIGDDNRDTLGALRVSDAQAPLIEPNPSWIAEALGLPECETKGIYWHSTPVGLYSLTDPRKSPTRPKTFNPAAPFYGA